MDGVSFGWVYAHITNSIKRFIHLAVYQWWIGPSFLAIAFLTWFGSWVPYNILSMGIITLLAIGGALTLTYCAVMIYALGMTIYFLATADKQPRGLREWCVDHANGLCWTGCYIVIITVVAILNTLWYELPQSLLWLEFTLICFGLVLAFIRPYIVVRDVISLVHAGQK